MKRFRQREYVVRLGTLLVLGALGLPVACYDSMDRINDDDEDGGVQGVDASRPRSQQDTKRDSGVPESYDGKKTDYSDGYYYSDGVNYGDGASGTYYYPDGFYGDGVYGDGIYFDSGLPDRAIDVDDGGR
jgi:hypothetical protein